MQGASGWGSALERGLPRRKGVWIHGRVGVEGKIRKERYYSRVSRTILLMWR